MQMRWFKYVLGALVVCSIGFGGYLFLRKPTAALPIYDFNESRDTQDILDIFKRDRYWLLASEDYSPEFMLHYRAPNTETQYLGRLKIKVWRQEGKLAGFTAYYIKEPGFGFLLFLDVNPEFRGKEKGSVAEKLMKYALGQLREMGANYVQLCTRVDNERARRLYRRIGFHEISQDSGFVYYQYDF